MQECDINKLIEIFKEQLKEVKLEKNAIEIRNIFVKKHINPLSEQLKSVSIANKKSLGLTINLLKNAVNQATNEVIQQLNLIKESSEHILNYDINIDSAKFIKGNLTPISLVTKEVIDFFKKMNFQIISGDEIVKISDNFDKLNISLNHPVRQLNDSFFINEQLMLRAQCTATTAEAIYNNKSQDIRILSFGNVYRKDDDDMTHSHQFNQIDIVWIKNKLSLQNLKWLIHELLKHLYGKDVKVRFRLSYFPFTEPSFEVDMSCPYCNNKGCSICKNTTWIELLGAGMLHKNVLDQANISIQTALAAGIGIDRLAMIKYKIKDIRDLYSNDFKILNQFKQ